MKKTVLITGVAGFMGSHLADKFLESGYHVRGIDNLIGGYKSNVPKNVDFHEIDLGDFDAVKDLFVGVDLVVHTACTAYEGLSVFSPALVTRNTSHITTVALSASVRAGVEKFVHLSSMARYGTQEVVPFTEDMTPKPQDPYGIAKYASELLIRNICETHGMKYVILVPHNIIGPRQKFNDPFRNVASIMINRMLSGKQPIIYGDGSQKRCFSFMQDVIDPLMIACETDLADGKVVNIGPDEEFVTIKRLAEIIAEILDFKLDAIYMPGRPQEVKDANCSADLARNLLGYKTTTSLEEGLEELTNWIKQQGAKDFEYHLPLEFVTENTPKTWTEKLI
jgi:UDP-glucose 4-epimerase